MAARCWFARRLHPSPLLHTHRLQFQSERQVHHNIILLRSPSIALNLKCVVRPRVASRHFLFGNSCRWLTNQSSKRSAVGNENAANNYSENNAISSSEEQKSSSAGTTTLINQRATNAILAQLSSPPNLLTLSRIVATPYLSYLLISHYHHKSEVTSSADVVGNDITTVSDTLDATTAAAADALSTATINLDQASSTPVIALSLFLAMGFTDWLDGYIARAYPSTATVLGTYLDPIADKFFISIMSLTMWYTGALPGMLVGLWVARDVGMVGSVYWLVRQETVRKQKSKNQDGLSNSDSNNIAVMDPQNTPLKLQASFLSKVNTTLQIGLIAMGIAGELPSVDIPPELMTSLIWITAGTTIGSSIGYLDLSALKKSGNK